MSEKIRCQCGETEDFNYVEDAPITWKTVRIRANKVVVEPALNEPVIDFESTTNPRLECRQCYQTIPIPEGLEVDFDER